MVRGAVGRRLGWTSLGVFHLGVVLGLGCADGCAGQAQVAAETSAAASAKDGRSAGAGPGGAADAGAAVPFALCRGFGLNGTPCYPTNVDIGTQVVSPCRERHRGHCELSGPRHTMACLLIPVPDGKPCGEGSVCKEGACVKQ